MVRCLPDVARADFRRGHGLRGQTLRGALMVWLSKKTYSDGTKMFARSIEPDYSVRRSNGPHRQPDIFQGLVQYCQSASLVRSPMKQKVSCLTCKCGRLMSVFQKSKTKQGGGFETAETYICRDRHWWNSWQHTPPIQMHGRIPKGETA